MSMPLLQGGAGAVEDLAAAKFLPGVGCEPLAHAEAAVLV